MQTPVRLPGTYRGRHHVPILATFRLTWRQGLCRGLGAGAVCALVLAVAVFAAPLVGPVGLIGDIADAAGIAGVSGPVRAPDGLPGLAWLGPLVPLPVGALIGLAVGRRGGVRIDVTGMHGLPLAPDGFTPWALVADVRAERRRGRTVIVVYVKDGSIRRLRAPYDGELLGRDPLFERKLFMICHLWATHRTCRPAAERR